MTQENIIRIYFFKFLFFLSHFTDFIVFHDSLSCTFLISFSPTFLDSTFILYCHSNVFCIFTFFFFLMFFLSLLNLLLFLFTLTLLDSYFPVFLVFPIVCMRSCCQGFYFLTLFPGSFPASQIPLKTSLSFQPLPFKAFFLVSFPLFLCHEFPCGEEFAADAE